MNKSLRSHECEETCIADTQDCILLHQNQFRKANKNHVNNTRLLNVISIIFV